MPAEKTLTPSRAINQYLATLSKLDPDTKLKSGLCLVTKILDSRLERESTGPINVWGNRVTSREQAILSETQRQKRNGDLLIVLRGDLPGTEEAAVSDREVNLALSLVARMVKDDNDREFRDGDSFHFRLTNQDPTTGVWKNWDYRTPSSQRKSREGLQAAQLVSKELLERFPRLRRLLDLPLEFWAMRVDPEYYLRMEEVGIFDTRVRFQGFI